MQSVQVQFVIYNKKHKAQVPYRTSGLGKTYSRVRRSERLTDWTELDSGLDVWHAVSPYGTNSCGYERIINSDGRRVAGSEHLRAGLVSPDGAIPSPDALWFYVDGFVCFRHIRI